MKKDKPDNSGRRDRMLLTISLRTNANNKEEIGDIWINNTTGFIVHSLEVDKIRVLVMFTRLKVIVCSVTLYPTIFPISWYWDNFYK